VARALLEMLPGTFGGSGMNETVRAVLIAAMIGLLLLVLLFLLPMLTMAGMMWGTGMPVPAPGGRFSPWVMLLYAVILVLVILGAFLLVIWLGRSLGSRPEHQEDEALRILRLRYARGEISREEYERMLKDLQSWHDQDTVRLQ